MFDEAIEIKPNNFLSVKFLINDAFEKGFKFGYAKCVGVSSRAPFFNSWAFIAIRNNSLRNIAATGDIDLKNPI